MEEKGKAEKEANLRDVAAPITPPEAAESRESPGHADIRMRPGPDLVLDERLTSAAAPFLYLLAIILIAVAGYFAYVFLHG